MATTAMATKGKPAQKAVPVLTQSDVDRYVQVCAQINALTEEKDKLKELGVTAMLNGQSCPMRGPNFLKLEEYWTQQNSWKDICDKIIGILTGRIAEMARGVVGKALSERKVNYRLSIRPNPEWGAK